MRSDVELEALGTSLGAPPAVTITRRAGGSAWVVDLGSAGESGNRRSGVLSVIFERQFEEHQHFSPTIEKHQLTKQQEERASDLAEYRAAQQRKIRSRSVDQQRCSKVHLQDPPTMLLLV